MKAGIASIDDQAWTPTEYTGTVFDAASGQWISRAEVAEITFTAFAAQAKRDHMPDRLIVRRILNSRPTSTARPGRTASHVWRRPGGSAALGVNA